MEISESFSVNIDFHKSSEINPILKQRKLMKESLRLLNSYYWEAESYNLQNVSMFRHLGPESQIELLKNCSRDRLEEAFQIENCGIAYAAKMILCADSLSERKLYSMMTADETRHLYIIEEHLDTLPQEEQAFVKFLHHLVENGSKRSLIFIIQVLLEGWGIDHYQKLAKGCTDPKLGGLLESIVIDEASHYGSGLILFDENELSANEFKFVADVLYEFFSMIQCGEIGLLSNMENICEGLTHNQRIQFLYELENQDLAYSKIQILKKLMHRASSNKIFQLLEKKNCFKPQSNSDVAKMLLN